MRPASAHAIRGSAGCSWRSPTSRSRRRAGRSGPKGSGSSAPASIGWPSPGVVLLHDRLRPGTTANIDHLAVAPTGVWVIDAKRYQGQVAKKDVGGWFSTDIRLYVGRRDCTKLVAAMSKQVAAVRAALGAEWAEVPVRPVLCFVDAEWGWFAKPFDMDGVLVTWGKAARELLVRPGPYAPESVELMAARLGERLRPASYDAGRQRSVHERPAGVAAVLEHLHRREGGVGEAAQRVAAPLARRQRRRPVAGQVEGVDQRHVVEPDVARVVLLVVGEDDDPLVALGVEVLGDGGVAEGGVAHRADQAVPPWPRRPAPTCRPGRPPGGCARRR